MVPVRRNQNWLPSIFNDFLGNDWLAERHNTTAPAVNIIEDENEYKVEVAAPGMTKEDFKVHINEDNELIVTMEKKAEQKEEEDKKKLPLFNYPFSILNLFCYPILLIFLSLSSSINLIFRPSIAIIRSATNVDNVRIALDVVIFERLAKSSRER